MNEGWIKLHRGIKEHWLWGSPTKLYWWIDVLFTVNWEDKKVLFGNKLIECKRGQSVLSMESWAEKWGVSEHTVRNFFKLLQQDEMVVMENLNFTSRLTVCNYETYQSDGRGSVEDRSRIGRALVGERATTKEVKEIKEVKEKKKHICDVPEKLQKIEGFNQAWEQWLAYRRERRLTVSPMCLSGQLKKLESSEKPIEIIEQSITNGWQGLFELKEGFKNANKSANRKLIGRDEYSDGDIFYNNYDQNQPTVQGNEEVQRSRGIPVGEPW